MTTDPGREVPLVAGETTYTLYAGNRALRLIERETGRPLLDALSMLEGGDINLLTTMLWALLQRNHQGLKVDDVDDIVDDAGGWEAILDPLTDAITLAFPSMKDDDKADSGKVSRGTGTRSSPAVSPAA